jgi:hypothetical protein
MTKTEIAAIRNVIARMKQVNMGSSAGLAHKNVAEAIKMLNEAGFDVVSRIYTESWVLPALELLLPDSPMGKRDPVLAEKLIRPNLDMPVWPRKQ